LDHPIEDETPNFLIEVTMKQIDQGAIMLKNTSMFGFLLLAASLFLYIFKLVSYLMVRELRIFSIEDLFGIDWVSSIPIAALQQAALAVSTAQIYVIFLILGLGLVLLSTFRKN
jgi:hypothetical protein